VGDSGVVSKLMTRGPSGEVIGKGMGRLFRIEYGFCSRVIGGQTFSFGLRGGVWNTSWWDGFGRTSTTLEERRSSS
jgi:hypothetical protein